MSTPINQLPTANAQSDQSDENQLVSEILKEINDNDTNQINMKEPPTVNENSLINEPEIVQNIPEQVIEQPEPTQNIVHEMEQVIPQEITKNLIVEELSLVDKVKKYAIEGLIIAALVIGAGFISPSIFNALSPLLNKIPALANHRDLLLKVFNALLVGILFISYRIQS